MKNMASWIDREKQLHDYFANQWAKKKMYLEYSATLAEQTKEGQIITKYT